MNKSQILDYTRSRLYMMGSNAAPSFTDESLYPFLDRAQQIVIQQSIRADRLDLIANLIDTLNSSDFSEASTSGVLWKSGDSDISNEFFAFITGYVYISEEVGDDGVKTPIEPVSIRYFDNVLDQSSRMRFPKPKVFFGHEGEFITIVRDSYTIYATKDADGSTITDSQKVEIKYVKNPTSFSDMENTGSPAISPQLHLDIVEKAAELTATVLNPQAAAQEIQNNNQAQQS